MIEGVRVDGRTERELREGRAAEAYFAQAQGMTLPGLGDMAGAVQTVLQERMARKAAEMYRRLPRIAQQGGERYRMEDREGGGEVRMQVDLVSHHYWGQRLGYECWQDEEFCREYLRDNAYARVRSYGRRTVVGWRAAQGYCRRHGTVMRANV